MLQLCVAQQNSEKPFSFKSTGIRVYSFEEVLYHVYHYWRESVDDFLSESMIAWVGELGLSYLASKMKDLTRETNLTLRLLGFLQLTPYFSADEIAQLKTALEAWAMRLEWEKLKERADYLVGKNEPAKAMLLYKRALQFEENPALLNNISVVCMQLCAYRDAVSYLTRARALDPSNVSIMLHYAEATILNGQYQNAKQVLDKVAAINPACPDIPFFNGLMAFLQKNYVKALQFYTEANKLAPSQPYYIYKTVEVHKAMRQFEKALEIIATVNVKDATYYSKEAEIHGAAGDMPAALRCMRRATSAKNDPGLWAKLAEYYRHNYDWQNAENAINHAIAIAPENDKVRLENARIKKGLGHTRDYQAELTCILQSFKERYRTSH